MTAQDVDKIIPFPAGRREAGERRRGNAPLATENRWEIVAPLLGWGGTVLAVLALPDPKSPAQTLFYAGTTAGCYVSADGGKTWSARNKG